MYCILLAVGRPRLVVVVGVRPPSLRGAGGRSRLIAQRAGSRGDPDFARDGRGAGRVGAPPFVRRSTAPANAVAGGGGGERCKGGNGGGKEEKPGGGRGGRERGGEKGASTRRVWSTGAEARPPCTRVSERASERATLMAAFLRRHHVARCSQCNSTDRLLVRGRRRRPAGLERGGVQQGASTKKFRAENGEAFFCF